VYGNTNSLRAQTELCLDIDPWWCRHIRSWLMAMTTSCYRRVMPDSPVPKQVQRAMDELDPDEAPSLISLFSSFATLSVIFIFKTDRYIDIPIRLQVQVNI